MHGTKADLNDVLPVLITGPTDKGKEVEANDKKHHYVNESFYDSVLLLLAVSKIAAKSKTFPESTTSEALAKIS